MGRAAQDGRMGRRSRNRHSRVSGNPAAPFLIVLPRRLFLPSFPRKRESRTVLHQNGIVGKQPRDSRLRGNDGRGTAGR